MSSAVHREFVESQASQPAPAAARPCHELGVCTGRPSVGCTCHHDTRRLPAGAYYFAPGAVERTRRRRPAPRWRRIAAGAARWAWRIVSVVCVLIVLLGLWGMATGVPIKQTTAVGKVHT